MANAFLVVGLALACLGLLLSVLPGPGLPFLVLGAILALVGVILRLSARPRGH